MVLSIISQVLTPGAPSMSGIPDVHFICAGKIGREFPTQDIAKASGRGQIG